MGEAKWPFNLPIWRSSFRAVSPDGRLVAKIDATMEVSMGNPTMGILCVSNGLHLERCNPSFVWSDDSKFLAVPQYFHQFGLFRRQRLLVIAMEKRWVYASRATAWYFQPESFAGGKLVATVNPFGSKRRVEFEIPGELRKFFPRDVLVPWPEETGSG